jgi:NADPH-ferrihemoprotein reductase
MATYGEGEPTDNAVELLKNLSDETYAFSNGEHKLNGLKYVVFGLGNRTYEHYNAIARKVDSALEAAGAKIIGKRGEGDDDKSLEEDYLEWKEEMWPAFAEAMGVEEGVGSDTPDFKVTEIPSHPADKVYLGKLLASVIIL